MQAEAILLIGIQAVGKSTFYQQRFATTHTHINLDTLKTRGREKAALETCLTLGQSFVIDNTNATETFRARYIPAAKRAGLRVIGYYFPSKALDALQRNRQRPAAVPDLAIWGTAKRLQPPRYAEGFDQLCYVTLVPPDQFEIQEWQDDL